MEFLENPGGEDKIWIKRLFEEIDKVKKGLPNGELLIMQKGLEDLKRNQDEMKESLSDLKKRLLDPEDGIIVKVNKNTEFRREGEERMSTWERKMHELEEIKKWKANVNKALWIIFGTVISLVIKVIFFPES